MSKKSIWTTPSVYGTYEGTMGDINSWKSAFNFAWGKDVAEKILSDGDQEWWEILEVSITANFETVKKEFHKKMLKHHPDKGGNHKVCQKIISAWVIAKESFGK